MSQTPAKHLSFDDFKPSQPKPTVPNKHHEGSVLVCEGCGATFPNKGAWCVDCINVWKQAYPAWLELNNAEFEAWFALHKHELTTPLKTNGIHNAEFVPDRIVNDRKKHFKDTIQPFRDGEPSGEYIRQYPDQAKKMFTETERRKAKDVWRDITPSHLKNTI